MNVEKLKRLQAQVRIGGKGTPRRKKKVMHQTAATDDKKLQSSLKKLSVSTIPGIEEVNIIKDDLTVIHFNNPKAQASLSANTFAVTGHGETKKIVEMLPEILPQLGQETVVQLRMFANSMSSSSTSNQKSGNAAGEVNALGSVLEEDDVPMLVSDFDEIAKVEAANAQAKANVKAKEKEMATAEMTKNDVAVELPPSLSKEQDNFKIEDTNIISNEVKNSANEKKISLNVPSAEVEQKPKEKPAGKEAGKKPKKQEQAKTNEETTNKKQLADKPKIDGKNQKENLNKKAVVDLTATNKPTGEVKTDKLERIEGKDSKSAKKDNIEKNKNKQEKDGTEKIKNKLEKENIEKNKKKQDNLKKDKNEKPAKLPAMEIKEASKPTEIKVDMPTLNDTILPVKEPSKPIEVQQDPMTFKIAKSPTEEVTEASKLTEVEQDLTMVKEAKLPEKEVVAASKLTDVEQDPTTMMGVTSPIVEYAKTPEKEIKAEVMQEVKQDLIAAKNVPSDAEKNMKEIESSETKQDITDYKPQKEAKQKISLKDAKSPVEESKKPPKLMEIKQETTPTMTKETKSPVKEGETKKQSSPAKTPEKETKTESKQGKQTAKNAKSPAKEIKEVPKAAVDKQQNRNPKSPAKEAKREVKDLKEMPTNIAVMPQATTPSEEPQKPAIVPITPEPNKEQNAPKAEEMQSQTPLPVQSITTSEVAVKMEPEMQVMVPAAAFTETTKETEPKVEEIIVSPPKQENLVEPSQNLEENQTQKLETQLLLHQTLDSLEDKSGQKYISKDEQTQPSEKCATVILADGKPKQEPIIENKPIESTLSIQTSNENVQVQAREEPTIVSIPEIPKEEPIIENKPSEPTVVIETLNENVQDQSKEEPTIIAIAEEATIAENPEEQVREVEATIIAIAEDPTIAANREEKIKAIDTTIVSIPIETTLENKSLVLQNLESIALPTEATAINEAQAIVTSIAETNLMTEAVAAAPSQAPQPLVMDIKIAATSPEKNNEKHEGIKSASSSPTSTPQKTSPPKQNVPKRQTPPRAQDSPAKQKAAVKTSPPQQTEAKKSEQAATSIKPTKQTTPPKSQNTASGSAAGKPQQQQQESAKSAPTTPPKTPEKPALAQKPATTIKPQSAVNSSTPTSQAQNKKPAAASSTSISAAKTATGQLQPTEHPSNKASTPPKQPPAAAATVKTKQQQPATATKARSGPAAGSATSPATQKTQQHQSPPKEEGVTKQQANPATPSTQPSSN